MRILVLDNYDSFTYNLVYIIRSLGFELDVFRNDKITLEKVSAYDKILLSPGPGIPDEAGILKELISTYGANRSILGVCLGHQAIAEVYGSELFNLLNVLHGVDSEIEISTPSDYIFRDIPKSFRGCHYHSWAVLSESLGKDLEVTARDSNGNIMALSHKTHDVKGLQFHPESILTEHGEKMIENWLKH